MPCTDSLLMVCQLCSTFLSLCWRRNAQRRKGSYQVLAELVAKLLQVARIPRRESASRMPLEGLCEILQAVLGCLQKRRAKYIECPWQKKDFPARSCRTRATCALLSSGIWMIAAVSLQKSQGQHLPDQRVSHKCPSS